MQSVRSSHRKVGIVAQDQNCSTAGRSGATTVIRKIITYVPPRLMTFPTKF